MNNQLINSEFNEDIYKISIQKIPLCSVSRTKYIATIFNNLMNKIELINPLINTYFSNSINARCFNNKSQFLRIEVIDILKMCIDPKYRYLFEKKDLYLLDNLEYIYIYKFIIDILLEFKSYYVILWFFFQVPNYLNYDITNYRKIYLELIDYIIDKWDISKHKIYSIDEFIKLTKGSTFYYNLVYHGKSNKILINKWNTLLNKIINLPHRFKDKEITKIIKYRGNNATRKENKIKICFISDKLRNYTSVFRDRIGIISMLNKELFDVYIGIYDNNEKINEFNINKNIFHPVISNFLNPFINNKKILILKKNNFNYNVELIKNKKFYIIFYPDLGMFQSQTLLSLVRLAPIQITTWGHSDTSGNNEIDYYITSKYFETIDNLDNIKNNYIEKPILLSSLGTYYLDPVMIASKFFNYKSNLLVDNKYQIDIDKLNSKKIIIGCMHSYYKFNKEFEIAIKKILDLISIKIENFELYLSNSIALNKFHIERINDIFGHKYKNNIKWFDYLSQDKWLDIISKCHIILDPFPFGGCNTSLEAFSMNIPVISLRTDVINGRFTDGFYKKMNLDTNGIIADSIDEYIKNTVNIILNKGYYNNIVKKIMLNKHLLFEEAKSVLDYENILKLLVEKKYGLNIKNE